MFSNPIPDFSDNPKTCQRFFSQFTYGDVPEVEGIDTECWIWTGGGSADKVNGVPDPYGIVSIDFKKYKTHRVMLDVYKRVCGNLLDIRADEGWSDEQLAGYYAVYGTRMEELREYYEWFTHDTPSPAVDSEGNGLVIDHLCKVRLCANPLHLEEVTAVENLRRGDAWTWRERITECPKGHKLEGPNLRNSAGKNSKNFKRACRTCAASLNAKNPAEYAETFYQRIMSQAVAA